MKEKLINLNKSHLTFYYKIIVVGNDLSGKTNIINRIFGKKFNENLTEINTLTVNILNLPDYSFSNDILNTSNHILVFWEISSLFAHNNKFRYYDNCSAVIIVVDIQNHFYEKIINQWLQDVRKIIVASTSIIILVNKIDFIINKEENVIGDISRKIKLIIEPYIDKIMGSIQIMFVSAKDEINTKCILPQIFHLIKENNLRPYAMEIENSTKSQIE